MVGSVGGFGSVRLVSSVGRFVDLLFILIICLFFVCCCFVVVIVIVVIAVIIGCGLLWFTIKTPQ